MSSNLFNQQIGNLSPTEGGVTAPDGLVEGNLIKAGAGDTIEPVNIDADDVVSTISNVLTSDKILVGNGAKRTEISSIDINDVLTTSSDVAKLESGLASADDGLILAFDYNSGDVQLAKEKTNLYRLKGTLNSSTNLRLETENPGSSDWSMSARNNGSYSISERVNDTSTSIVRAELLTGASAWTFPSDRNVKTNIEKLDVKLPKSIGYIFDYKDNLKNNIHKKKYGLMAQDLQEFLPSAVESNGECLTVDYNQVSALCLHKICEQQQQILELQKSIDTLNKKLKEKTNSSDNSNNNKS